MSLELFNTIASFLTFLVIAATAIAAIVQLRHLRASNQLAALVALNQEFRDSNLQESLRFVQRELQVKLQDPEFRDELGKLGFIDSRVHPEMIALNWLNEIGTLVKHGLVNEQTFLDLFSRLVVQYWELLSPVIALLRRQRGSAEYQNFEYLTIRSRQWMARYPVGFLPPGPPRLEVLDPWLVADAGTQVTGSEEKS